MTFDPGTDPTLEDIAEWLHERLNEFEPGCVASTQVLTIAGNPAVLTDILNLSAYPFLGLHLIRATGENLEQCEGGIEYILPVNNQNKKISLAWFGKALARALREYNDQLLGDDALDGGSLQVIKNPSSFVSEHDMQGRGSGLFHQLRFRFEYWDRAEV